jgi:hypothetical protein
MTRLTVSRFGAPGFVKDVAEYAIAPQAFNEVRNARFNSNGVETFPGEIEVMSQAAEPPVWLRPFPPIEQPLWMYSSLQRVYVYDGTHQEITRLSGIYSGNALERPHGEVFNGIGVWNNTIDVPQMWADFDASQRLQDLSNWPATLRCKFLRPYGNFLVAGHLTDAGQVKPFRIRWSNAADPGTVPNSWALNDPTSLSGEKDLATTDDYIVDGLELGTLFMIYKQKSVYYMNLIYPNPDVFATGLVIPHKGILTRDCVQKFPAVGDRPGGHAVFGVDDIYAHTGARNSEVSLVEARLRNWIFNQIDSSNYMFCYTYIHQRRNEIGFCFPEAGETYPTLALVWNWVTNGIGVRDLHRSPFIYPGPILVSVEDDIWGEDTVETFNLITNNGDALVTQGLDNLIWS